MAYPGHGHLLLSPVEGGVGQTPEAQGRWRGRLSLLGGVQKRCDALRKTRGGGRREEGQVLRELLRGLPLSGGGHVLRRAEWMR